MTAFTLRFEDSLAKKLEKICLQKGYSKTGLIKSLVRDFLEKNDPAHPAKKTTQSLKNLVGIVRLGGHAVDDADNVFNP